MEAVSLQRYRRYFANGQFLAGRESGEGQTLVRPHIPCAPTVAIFCSCEWGCLVKVGIRRRDIVREGRPDDGRQLEYRIEELHPLLSGRLTLSCRLEERRVDEYISPKHR